jgi:type IX secretion system PorP/SprF family membrane protein
MSLAYAYHLELAKSMQLSFGIFGGVIQYQIDGNQIFLADEEERFLFDGIESIFVPDASLGMQLEGDKWYAGIALNHLLHNKIKDKPFDNSANSYGTLEYHAFITGGYLLPINKNFEMTPSVLIKVLPNNVMQVDVSAKLSYQHKFWGGVSYRSTDILSVLAGYDLNEKLYAGYAYDLTTKGLKNYSAGSHEVVLGYRLINDHTKKETRRTLD